MQNPHTPEEFPRNADLLRALCDEIEITWNARRDATVVDRLAVDHPDLADALYEFFALLVQAELDLDQPDEALGEHDARAKQQLEAGGYAEVAEIARREGAFASRTDDEVPVPGASAELKTPASVPPTAPSTPTTPAGPPVGQHDRPTDAPPEGVTPATEWPEAGVPRVGGGRRSGPMASLGMAGRRSARRNFLGLLIDTTDESPESIAAGLGITASLLVSVDDLGDRLPVRARGELARRCSATYGLSRELLLDHLGGSEPLPMAASRGSTYDQQLTYQEVVRRSKLSPADEVFWLSLAD